MPKESIDLSNLKNKRPDLFDPSFQDDNVEVKKENSASSVEMKAKNQ